MDQSHPSRFSVNNIDLFLKKSANLTLIWLIGFSFLLSGCENPTDKFSQSPPPQNEVTVIEGTQWSAKENPDEPDVITEVSNLSSDKKIDNDIAVNTGIFLQVGAFLNANNAIRLQQNLETKGYKPLLITQTSKNKKWNIVRLGPYSNRTDALTAGEEFTEKEEMDTIVLDNGLVIKNYSKKKASTRKHRAKAVQTTKQIKASKVITEESQELPGFEQEVDPTSTQEPKKPFSFQIGGLYSTENAKKHLKIYQKKGYSPYLIEITDKSSNDSWYSIRIGHYESAQGAIDAAQLFTSKEGIPAQIRPLKY